MSSSAQSLVDFWGVITESKRIINAHSRHFLALSVLFLLPLSFSLIVLPTLFHTFTSSEPNHIVSLLRLSLHSDHPRLLHHYGHHLRLFRDQKTLTFSLLFFSFILLLALAGIGSITYSVFHGFYGRPVKLISAIKSLVRSFLPLFVTTIAAQIVAFLIFALLGLIMYLGTKGFELIVGEFSYNSPHFIGASLIGAVLLGLVLVYVSVNWYLMNVIVVVESKWVFQPMIRSKGLVRGMRWVVLSLIMFFGFLASVLLWISMLSLDGDSGSMNDGWNTWAFIMRTVLTCAALTLILLHSIAASTVLYMYCKALHGELAGEIANEFAAEYVSLPFDDKKVPHIVFYVQ